MSEVPIKIIPVEEFRRIEASSLPTNLMLSIISDMNRVNALSAVKRAGSGHLGSSLSSMDLIVRLYYKELNIREKGLTAPDRDIYFSSKGHDVPAFYTMMYSLGFLPEEKLMKLRRMGGLEGHPDVSTPGVEANSGSLGMGISKAKGMAWAKRAGGLGGRVFVLTGDGEWQEGQNYEALQSAVQQKLTNLTVIIDHNKIQSDKALDDIVSLGDLPAKIKSFGWHVIRCNGNSQDDLEKAFAQLAGIDDRPKLLIADTLKGYGVSFMEHPTAMNRPGCNGLYPWHAGAPKDEDYLTARKEVLDRINKVLSGAKVPELKLKDIVPLPSHNPVYTLDGEPVSIAMPAVSKKGSKFVAEAYSNALEEAMRRRKDIVVLDADLSADCRVRKIEDEMPERFIECGIAEQDMVSMAGGLARQGLLPVVNSFASFLASRANEQIYNNASENTKIIYVNHYAGMIPAGPGKSHQSTRDISLLGALPNCEIIQPCNQAETKMVVDYAIDECSVNAVIRLVIGPSPRDIDLPSGYSLKRGLGVVIADGSDAVVIAYGPVMLHEVLIAAKMLATKGISLRIVNMPWLNRCDRTWLTGTVQDMQEIIIVDDHSPVGGLGDFLISEMSESDILQGGKVHKFAVEGYPKFGTPPEALKAHGLDGMSIAERIKSILHK